MLEICLIGCGGMLPLPERRLTSMLLRHNGTMVLVDCGEGTQVGIKLLGWGFKRIDALCLTHYHADHVAGLPGFLLTLGNSGRTEPFTIFGPPPLEFVIRSLTVIAPELPFDLILKELPVDLESSNRIGAYQIRSLPMDHRIPCLAYCFEIARSGKFQKDQAMLLKIPQQYWGTMQNGMDIVLDGKTIHSAQVMGPPRKGLKVTYCTDSRPSNALTTFAHQSDLLILEGLYGDDSLMNKAMERKHMIFSEAAAIASESCSEELWLTHFSPAFREPEKELHAAAAVFPNTVIGHDLMTKELIFIDTEHV